MKNKRRNLWMSATLICSLFVIAFKFDNNGIQWFWTGQEIVPVVLGISALIFGTSWFRISKRQTEEVQG